MIEDTYHDMFDSLISGYFLNSKLKKNRINETTINGDLVETRTNFQLNLPNEISYSWVVKNCDVKYLYDNAFCNVSKKKYNFETKPTLNQSLERLDTMIKEKLADVDFSLSNN